MTRGPEVRCLAPETADWSRCAQPWTETVQHLVIVSVDVVNQMLFVLRINSAKITRLDCDDSCLEATHRTHGPTASNVEVVSTLYR